MPIHIIDRCPLLVEHSSAADSAGAAQISIDGHTDISFTENVQARYDALGWHTQHVANGNTDMDAIRKAVEEAKKVTDKPSFIRVSPHHHPPSPACCWGTLWAWARAAVYWGERCFAVL